jgi:large subunit ribosomal protein L2
MAIIVKRPLTPGQRFQVQNKQKLAKKRPEKLLTKAKTRTGGRNCYGRITSRRRGGGHKKLYRQIDFKRNKDDVPAKVQEIEYDPNRTANIALLAYADGEKRYILAPKTLKIGDTVISSAKAIEFNPGNNMPIKDIPLATKIHSIETQINGGAKIARSAGVAAQVLSIESNRATLKMPSGEIRLVNANCRATIGEVGNSEHQKVVIGKAGRNRWKGKRPRVRGVAMNPVDHPMGGGEGRTSGGGHPVSPWGQLAKGFPTRTKSKPSNRMILVRRNGRKVKH